MALSQEPQIQTDSAKKRRHPLPSIDAKGVMDLSRTFVGSNGLLDAVKLASTSSNCRHLVLTDHQVTSDLLHTILKELDGATHLESINLAGNPITHSGGRELALFVRCNPNVQMVNVENTSVSPAQAKAISERAINNANLSQDERSELQLKQKKLKEAQDEQLKNRSRYRLTVSNVRLLNSLAEDQQQVNKSEAGMSRQTTREASVKITTTTEVAQKTGETPLYALRLLSEVIGGGYEQESGESPARKRNPEPGEDHSTDDAGSSVAGDED